MIYLFHTQLILYDAFQIDESQNACFENQPMPWIQNNCHNQENNSHAPPSHAIQPPKTTSEKIKSEYAPNVQRKLPAMAKVKQQRIPNAYDKTALKLEVIQMRNEYSEC
jgi:hypothetical protein